jgi:hypothetical protein
MAQAKLYRPTTICADTGMCKYVLDFESEMFAYPRALTAPLVWIMGSLPEVDICRFY